MKHTHLHVICAKRAQSRMRKNLKNGSLAKLKNGMKLGAHERQGQFAEGGKRQRVLDAVADVRRARVHLVKDVMVHPFSVRAFQLLVDKLKRRIPAADSRPPPQRQTVKKDRVVDQCSFIHANRHRGDDLESSWHPPLHGSTSARFADRLLPRALCSRGEPVSRERGGRSCRADQSRVSRNGVP